MQIGFVYLCEMKSWQYVQVHGNTIKRCPVKITSRYISFLNPGCDCPCTSQQVFDYYFCNPANDSVLYLTRLMSVSSRYSAVFAMRMFSIVVSQTSTAVVASDLSGETNRNTFKGSYIWVFENCFIDHTTVLRILFEALFLIASLTTAISTSRQSSQARGREKFLSHAKHKPLHLWYVKANEQNHNCNLKFTVFHSAEQTRNFFWRLPTL